jgi:hypothetical protein
LWARARSERLRAIRIDIHSRSRRPRKAGGNGFTERRLSLWGSARVESLRLSIRLALGAQGLWEILRLRLTLALHRVR